MAHSHHNHREQQVAHRRVDKILSGSPPGAKQHAMGDAFSKITSKTAAVQGNVQKPGGNKGPPSRYARGGKVGQTNIAIIVPSKGGPGDSPTPGGPPPMPPPMAGPPPGGPPMMPPPGAGGPPPGGPPMPMRARGGKIAGGEAAKASNLNAYSARAKKNSYASGGKIKGGAGSGVGRLDKAHRNKSK